MYRENRLDSASFISKVDKKGRVLVSAELRKKLGLRFGTQIVVSVDGKKFFTKVDERGRFSVPARIRNGRGGVKVNIQVCGETFGKASKVRRKPVKRVRVPPPAPLNFGVIGNEL